LALCSCAFVLESTGYAHTFASFPNFSCYV
jgi:hypothetical protein